MCETCVAPFPRPKVIDWLCSVIVSNLLALGHVHKCYIVENSSVKLSVNKFGATNLNKLDLTPRNIP